MGKYIPIQTNREITGEVLNDTSDKTIPELMLPKIVYNIKKKLGCIFVENHNSEPMGLKRGQTIGLVTLCVGLQEEQSQAPSERSNAMQSVARMSNDRDTHIGSASEGDAEKAGWKADSVQSVENRQFFETEEEKLQFTCESFELDKNKIYIF